MVIGLLPGLCHDWYFRPLLLALARLVRGLGLGGEWGGAALLATENAPPRKRALYGSFRSWAHRLASSLPTALSCCFHGY